MKCLQFNIGTCLVGDADVIKKLQFVKLIKHHSNGVLIQNFDITTM
jgi:hypothetical protein